MTKFMKTGVELELAISSQLKDVVFLYSTHVMTATHVNFLLGINY